MDNPTNPSILGRVQFAINRAAASSQEFRDDPKMVLPGAEFDALAEALAPKSALYAMPVGRSGTLLFCNCWVTRE